MVNINVNNIFFKSYSIDPNSGHSVYVFDSTYLPDPDTLGNDKQVYDMLIDELMDTLIAKLPSSPYSLVVFSSGFSQKKISWVYGIKMFSKIPKELKYYLQKTYIVHESFFIRTVYQVLSNAMNIKFLTKMSKYNIENRPTTLEEDSIENSSFSMVHVPDLTTLSQLIDITRLRISLKVYLHDYSINEYIDVPDDYFTRLSDIGKRKYRQLIFDKIFKKLSIKATSTELVFQKPGSYKKVNIFLDIIERNNYIDLSQWDIYSLASVFLNFIRNKTKPLVPIDLIRLPILDDVEYTTETFERIIHYNKYYDLFITIFPLFIAILDANEVTKHTSKSLSRSIAPALCKEKISINNNDRIAIGTRFIKNLLENFNAILRNYEQKNRIGRSPAILPPINTKVEIRNNTPQLPKPRKSSPTKYPTNSSRKASNIEDSPIKSFSSLKLMDNRTEIASSTGNSDDISNLLDFQPTIPYLQQRISSNDSISKRIISNNSTGSIDNVPQRISSNISTNSLDRNYQYILSRQSSVTSFASDEYTRKSNMSIDTSDDLIDHSVESPTKEKFVIEIPKISSSQDMISDMSSYRPPEPTKIEIFDKELKKQRQLKQKEISTKEKFSQDSFSTITTSRKVSKVSKLAALYEERLQGLQVMNEIMKSK